MDSWETLVGNQSPRDFMEISTGHEFPWTDDEIETAVRKYMSPEDCPWDDDEIEDRWDSGDTLIREIKSDRDSELRDLLYQLASSGKEDDIEKLCNEFCIPDWSRSDLCNDCAQRFAEVTPCCGSCPMKEQDGDDD